MYHQPETFEEALALRARYGDGITPLAGGTDLLVALNRGQWRPGRILDLTRVREYDGVARRNGDYVLGGGATYTRLAKLPVAALAEASLRIGGAQIRNRGTIAGNLGTASPAGDGCVALLAVDAEVELAHAQRGRRTVPVRDFFLDYRRTALQADELISAVRIPANWNTAWYKIGKRGSVNISLVCIAVGRSPEGRYCIGLGCVGPYPLRAPKTEALLSGNRLTNELIEDAAALVMTEVAPIDDHRGSAKYRRAMCGTLLRRLLTESFLNADTGSQP